MLNSHFINRFSKSYSERENFRNILVIEIKGTASESAYQRPLCFHQAIHPLDERRTRD